MKSFVAIVLLAACGNPKSNGSTAPSNTDPPPPMQDTRSEFEKRLDAACSALGPKLTRCAVDDADMQLAEGAITKQQHAEITKPEVQEALTRDFHDKCNQPQKRSSRQIRVLEVCFKEETECAPLNDCLDNMNLVK